MAANEINFQVLSTIPALLLSYWLLSTVATRVIRGRSHRQLRQAVRHDLGRAAALTVVPRATPEQTRAKQLRSLDAAFVAAASMPRADARAVQRACLALAFAVRDAVAVALVLQTLSLQSPYFHQ